MSTWTVADEEQYILAALRRYDPKIEAITEQTHHAKLLQLGSEREATVVVHGPLFVVRRKGKSTYNFMLMNRKVQQIDKSKETVNVWIGAVPLGPTARMEMKDNFLMFTCAKNNTDHTLYFSEAEDVIKMATFVQNCKSSRIADLRSLLHSSDGSSQVKSLRDSGQNSKQENADSPTIQMDWDWLHDNSEVFEVPDLRPKRSITNSFSVDSSTQSKPVYKKKRQ